MTELLAQLQAAFPQVNFQSEAPLAPLTAVKIGGPAEVLASLNQTTEVTAVIQYCHQQQIPVTMLGWGANTLISDRGIRGVVIRNLTRELSMASPAIKNDLVTEIIESRHLATVAEHDFAPLDYKEDANTPRVLVTAASGWPLASLMSTLLAEGVTGLQWYSRIPATLGGAIVNNIHGGNHFLSECVESVRVLGPDNEVVTLTGTACDFDYDYSRFHHTQETILSAQLRLWKGDVPRARQTVTEWAKRKSRQPACSLGCVFQNLSAREQSQLQLPTPSIGYIIDQVLQLKGFRVGGAQISTTHAAFIENIGESTAQNYLNVVLHIHDTAYKRLGLKLKPEIFFRGFQAEELAPLLVN